LVVRSFFISGGRNVKRIGMGIVGAGFVGPPSARIRDIRRRLPGELHHRSHTGQRGERQRLDEGELL